MEGGGWYWKLMTCVTVTGPRRWPPSFWHGRGWWEGCRGFGGGTNGMSHLTVFLWCSEMLTYSWYFLTWWKARPPLTLVGLGQGRKIQAHCKLPLLSNLLALSLTLRGPPHRPIDTNLAPQSVDPSPEHQHYPSTHWNCQLSGPTLGLLNQGVDFNKIPDDSQAH